MRVSRYTRYCLKMEIQMKKNKNGISIIGTIILIIYIMVVIVSMYYISSIHFPFDKLKGHFHLKYPPGGSEYIAICGFLFMSGFALISHFVIVKKLKIWKKHRPFEEQGRICKLLAAAVGREFAHHISH